jgi:hypothetical protein
MVCRAVPAVADLDDVPDIDAAHAARPPRPWTSENFVLKVTAELKSLRSSPMRKMTTAVKTRPTNTNKPTFTSDARFIGSTA